MARSDPNAVPARNLQGVFLDTAASTASVLRVLVEDFSDRDGFGPVVWNPLRDGTGWVYPQAGDRAWISEVRGELRSEWVVTFWQPAALLAGPAVVTSLPVAPADGQEIYFAADAANGVIWRLRYRAAAVGAYKWEFVGGSELFAEVATLETRTNTAYGDLATVGPALTLPVAGDYLIEIGADLFNGTAAANSFMSYAVGATAATDTDSLSSRNSDTTINTRRSDSRRVRRNGLAAVSLTAKYRSDAGTGSYQHRWMSVRPVRVG